MQWTIHRPFVPPTMLDRVDRLRLRRTALRYAAHGWPVLPGACLTGDRFACGRAGCQIVAGHPAIDAWENSASSDPAKVAEWWRHRPHTILLATGWTFDVLEVPAALGLRTLGAIRRHDGVPGPIAVTAAGSWMFLVRPGRSLRTELDDRLDVLRHGRGSWIPAAPSRMPGGQVRWAVPPERTQWSLPEADIVQAMVVEAIGTLGRRPVPRVPRQTSTLRRAA
jgi:hypothetical protein